jgi:hypothetical protein
MISQQEVLNQFYASNPTFDVRANDGLLLTNCPRPITVSGLDATAKRLKHLLATNPVVAKAFADFYAENPQWANVDANTNILTELHRGDDISLESLREVSRSSQCHLAINAATQEAERALQHRRQLISEIANHKESYCVWDKAHGQTRFYKVADLNDESDATVLEVHGLVMEYRRLAGTPISELRKQERPDDVFLAHPDHPEREYAPAELKKLQRHEFRRLLFTDSGQSKPGVSEAITRILKGQV